MNQQTIEKYVQLTKNNICQFEKKNHPAWKQSEKFTNRINNLPLYWLEFNHPGKNEKTQSVTVTHYVPCRTEIMVLSKIIKSFNKDFKVCDIGCGNGFLGSLLAREGVKVFGIDDRSYNQPQIKSFLDKECYKIIETSLSDLKIPFDVAFCSWMTPGTNLMPQIIAKKPSLIIHVFSPDRQRNGTPTTGTQEANKCTSDYRLIVGWRTVFPKDYFIPLNEIYGLKFTENVQKIRIVNIFAHKKLKLIDCISDLDITSFYDWDVERNFINQFRIDKGLKHCLMDIQFKNT